MIDCSSTRQESKDLEGALGASNASYAAPLVYSLLEDSMKKIPLSRGYFTIVDDDDYKWIEKRKWYVLKTKNTNYAWGINPENNR